MSARHSGRDCNMIISSGGSRIGGNAMTFPVKVFHEGFVIILHAAAACVQSAMGFTRRTPHSRTTTTTTTAVAATTIAAAAAITTADAIAVLP